jgi:phage terminase large subunit GpA-like protein
MTKKSTTSKAGIPSPSQKKREAELLNTVNLFKRLNTAWEVPPKLNVSDWADEYRRLSAESSAEVGRWRTSRAEYQREPMDAISDPAVRKVVLHFSSQTGKSEILNNTLGYYMAYDPSPILFIQPTEDDVRAYSQDRVAPMIRDTPVLSERVVDAKSRDSGNTIMYKKFTGGYVQFLGANVPSKLASRPIKVVLADEIDRYPMSAGKEGNPLALAEVRQTTFWNAKTVVCSTPTIEGASAIDREYESSSQHELNIACPHCGEYQTLEWSGIKFNHFKEQEAKGGENKFELLGYACKYCGCIDSEIKWKRQPIKWIAKHPEVKKVRGYHLNALISPWKTWHSLVDDFLTAKKDPEKLKVFVNTMLAESWREKSEIDFNELLAKRRQYYNCQIPRDVVALTMGVDTQDNRLEYEIVGWSAGHVSWGIKYGIILGDPAQPEPWEQLDKIIDAVYERVDGLQMHIMSTCIDSGGHKTDEVYKYCKSRFYKNVYAIKGQGGTGIPFVKIPKKPNDAGVFLFMVGVDVGKDTLMSRLKVQYETEQGFCHFPIEGDRGYNEEYFQGLTSERKVTKYVKGVAKIAWEKISEHARNEPFDLRIYASVALEIKQTGLSYDLLEALHKQLNTEPPPEQPVRGAEKAENAPKTQPRATGKPSVKVSRVGQNQPKRPKMNGGIGW